MQIPVGALRVVLTIQRVRLGSLREIPFGIARVQNSFVVLAEGLGPRDSSRKAGEQRFVVFLFDQIVQLIEELLGQLDRLRALRFG